MEKKRSCGFTIFIIVMVLIALLGVGLMIFGGMTYEAVPKASPWTVARCVYHG